MGCLATGQNVQREKGQQCRKCQEANEWVFRKDSLRGTGTSILITLGPEQRSEAHNIHTYLPHTDNILLSHTQTNTDVTFLVNSSQMSRLRFCNTETCKLVFDLILYCILYRSLRFLVAYFNIVYFAIMYPAVFDCKLLIITVIAPLTAFNLKFKQKFTSKCVHNRF